MNRNKGIQLTSGLFAGLLCASAVFAGLIIADQAQAAPVIESPEPAYDFGTVDNVNDVEHAFVITNAGDEPLEIGNVKTSCGCTVAKPEKNSLAPGESTTIGAKLSLKGRKGNQHKVITVSSNDPVNPAYKLEINGVAVSAVAITPDLINFGSVPEGEERVEKAIVEVTKEDFTLQLQEPQPQNEILHASISEIEPGKKYEVSVTVKSDKIAPLNGVIKLPTDNPQYDNLQLRVTGQVVGAFQTMPGQIMVRETPEGQVQPAVYVRVLPGRIKEFQITEVVAPMEGIGTEIIERGANDYLVKLSDIPLEAVGKSLVIKTNIEGEQIELPFIATPAPDTNKILEQVKKMLPEDMGKNLSVRVGEPVQINAPAPPEAAESGNAE